MDPAECLDGGLQRPGTAEDRAAEALPRDLDPLGQRDLLRTRQQRNLRHLRQVHPDRVVAGIGGGRGDRLVAPRRRLRFSGWGRDGRGGGLIEEVDPPLLQRHEQRIDLLRIDRLVGQVGVDLIERQVPLLAAGGDQRRQIAVGGGVAMGSGGERDGVAVRTGIAIRGSVNLTAVVGVDAPPCRACAGRGEERRVKFARRGLVGRGCGLLLHRGSPSPSYRHSRTAPRRNPAGPDFADRSDETGTVTHPWDRSCPEPPVA